MAWRYFAVRGDRRRTNCDDELCDLCWTPDIVQVFILRRMRWVGHVDCMRDKSKACRTSVRNVRKRDKSEDI